MTDLYDALTLPEGDQIRLIHIHPADGAETIFCELQVVALSDEPNYVALSYTWGPATSVSGQPLDDLLSTPTHPILCKTISASGSTGSLWHEHLVTNNLYAFLHRVRNDLTLARKSYWIDAICINQDDPEERTRQVGIMPAIYRSASVVYAWLGEEDQDTRTSFDLIRALSTRCDGDERHLRIRPLSGITPESLKSGALTTELGTRADMNAWKALVKLLNRRYFTRAWMIQEVTLAKEMSAYCGSHSVGWKDIVKVSEFLTMTTWTNWIAEVMDSRANYHSVPNILDANQSSQDFLYALIRFRRFSSADPRDKVYALLGLAGESIRERRRLRPIYGERSVAETYILTAIQVLEDSDDLLLLTCAEGDKFRSIPSLPSWVPDWSCAQQFGLGVTGYRRFWAAGTIPRYLDINEREHSLTIKGFRLDDITLAGESKQDVADDRPFPKWIKMINTMPPMYHTSQTRSEVFWRSLISDTSGAPPDHPAAESYRSTYRTGMAAKIRTSIEQNSCNTTSSNADSTAFQVFSVPDDSSLGSQGDFKAESTNGHGGSSDYETLFSYSLHLRPFLTVLGYLGVGSESLREGDSVWIVLGCRVPLILRQLGADTFSIVGGAYVHGFMRGEALESGPTFNTITIL